MSITEEMHDVPANWDGTKLEWSIRIVLNHLENKDIGHEVATNFIREEINRTINELRII